MRLHFPIRHARTIAVAGIVIASSTAAFGQSGRLRLDGAVAATALQAAQSSAPGAGQPRGVVRRLSIDEAVQLALEQNLGIRIQRIDPQVQDVGVSQARSFWQPSLSTTFLHNSQTQQPTSALSGSARNILNGAYSTQVGLSQTLPWGGSYSASWDNRRSTTTNLFATFTPQLNSTLNLQYTQPLLRNFSIDQIRQQVADSRKARELSDIQLQAVITQTLRNVKNAYWDLVYAIDNLKAQQQSLALSQQFLKDNEKRVEIGTLAPIDIVQAQAEVASNEQGVIVAAAAIDTAQDNLRTLILDPGTADFWTVSFEPTDAPAFEEQALDVDAAVRNALDKRSDLRSAKNSLEQSDTNIKFYRNQVLPDVNAQLTYSPTAAGGIELTPVDFGAIVAGAPVTRSIVSDRGFGSVLGDVFGASYPAWSVGVQIGYPLGASTARANLARAQLQYEQAQAQVKNIEMQIAAQVRAVARNVETNVKRVESARASRALQEKKLEAEEKKLAAGMSQSFFVFQAQRDLAVARTAEIQAIADYNKSLVDFEAVQQVPITGGSAPITTAGSGAIQTGSSAIIRQ